MLSLYVEKCNKGDGHSCLVAGWEYTRGTIVPVDKKKAVSFFEKGANLNDFECCCNLGRIYFDGSGADRDYDKSRLYYEKACRAGCKCGCEGLKEVLKVSPKFQNEIYENCDAKTIEFTHQDTKIVFTDRVGSLIYDGAIRYDDPQFGISIAYNASKIAATIYIYNMGNETIPNTPFSEKVSDEFKQALYEIESNYRNVEVVSIDIVELSNRFILHAMTKYNDQDKEKLSHLLIWPFGNNFIKIRFTYDIDNENDGLRSLEVLFRYMSQYIPQNILSFKDGMEAYNKEDLSLAYMIWNHLVDKGDVASKYGLAILYLKSHSVDAALYWLQQAAEEGYPMAQHDLGQIYCEGVLVKKDMHKCAYWIKKSMDSGYKEKFDTWNDLSLEKYL